LTQIQAWNSNLNGTYFDVSGCPNLTGIQVSGNPNLSTIDVTNNPLLTFLYCQDGNISTIDLSNNTLLTTLAVNGNSLTSLNLTNNPLLTFLYAYQNTGLSSITGLSSLTSLITLGVYNCDISSLNLTTLTNLEDLSCGGTALTSVNLSTLTKLKTLALTNSIGITALNLPAALNSLKTVNVGGSSLTQSEVDSLLVKVNANGITGGSFNSANTGVPGTGTNATPSAVGLSAKTSLIAKGWSVVTN
jgi:hypothetical protein